MKKSILVLLLVIGGSISLFAQTTPSSTDLKPGVGSYGFVASIDGLSSIKLAQQGTLGFRYVLADGLVGRLNLNVTASHSSTTDTIESFPGSTDVTKTNSTAWMLKLGIQKNFAGTNRLEPYVGADIGIGNNGGGKTDETITTTSGSVTNVNEVIRKNAHGVQFGIVPFVGFNYYIAPRFAVGAEFGWGLFISSLTGGSTETKNSNGTTSTDVTQTTAAKSSSLGVGSTGSSSISLTVWFK